MSNFKGAENFRTRHPDFIPGFIKDLRATGRLLFKAYIIVQVCYYVKKLFIFPKLSGNTWYMFDQRILKHPIAPPFNIPHHTDFIEKEKYDNLLASITHDIMLDNIRLQYMRNEDPERETSTIIDEYLYDNDTDRMFEEMKFVANTELVDKKIIGKSDTISKPSYLQELEETRKSLKSKIKPA